MYMRLQSPVKLPVVIIARVLVLLGWRVSNRIVKDSIGQKLQRMHSVY